MGKFGGFSSVEMRKPKKSTFDLSHDKRLTTSMATLTPVFVSEAMPSDHFRGSTEILLRLAPLLAPIFDRIFLYVHFFFIPCRLLWEEWEPFITGGRLGVGTDPSVAPIPPRFEVQPYLDAGRLDQGSLADYMGIPPVGNVTPTGWTGKFMDLMPMAAYQCVWFNYYRDRNFVADDVFGATPNGQFPPLHSGTYTIGGGDNGAVYFNIRQRAYEHDYFTSALPFTQRGEEVLMPIQLGGLAPLYAEPLNPASTSATLSGIEQPGSSNVGYGVLLDGAQPSLPAGSSTYVRGEDFDGTSTSINDFRSAYAIQVWLERNAVGGSRYNESTQAHFGVRPQDSRLQRPEYIGGGKIPVQISEVVSTSWSIDNDDNAIPQANMAGHGITYGNTNQFNYFCAEHGFIIGVMSIMPVPSYHQGLPRMFRRGSFIDYPWPTFARLGEQPVNDFEIYCDPASLTPDADGEYPEFGFQSRYADWKYIPSSNHGDFHNTLAFWTITREFTSPPVLGEAFNTVGANADSAIFAVNPSGTSGNYWAYLHNKVSVTRALPYFGTPNTLGFS